MPPEQPPARQGAVVGLLEQWMAGDGAERRETFELLRRALDEQRPAGC
ncbi:MAG: hypothetical protein HY822_01410 [Acidobacteria bacterium]|nr:hypothetical protein [Acidobacteriota bacterium]